MAYDVHAARVRRHHPTDRRRAASAQVDTDLPAGGARCGLYQRQGRTGSDRHLAGDPIDVLDLVQAQQAHHDLAASRHRPADEPGVAALGHHAHAGIGADDEHARDFVGRSRADDRQRFAVEPPGPVGLIGGAKAGVGQAVALADDLPERVDERVGGHWRILTARGLRSDRRTGGEPMVDDRPERQPLPSEDGGDLVDEPASGETEDYLVASAEGVPYVPPTERSVRATSRTPTSSSARTTFSWTTAACRATASSRRT